MRDITWTELTVSVALIVALGVTVLAVALAVLAVL